MSARGSSSRSGALMCPKRAISVTKARRTGLVLRPLAETVRDVLADLRARPASRTLRAGLTSENEARLLATWRRNPSGS